MARIIIGEKMDKIIKLTRQSAADGMVLLKNKDVLPFKQGETVAVFGRCQLDYYRSGTGSGGAVNTEYTVNAIEGLKANKSINLNEEVLSHYEKWVEENPFDDGGGGWAAEPWYQKEMILSDELVLKAKSTSNKAVVIIGRTAGEDQDNADVEGSYRLTEEELDMLKKVTTHFDKVVVVLNVSNIIDMSWVNDPSHDHPIQAVLYAWHGGQEGGNALADILTGEVVPSGKLTDTIAYRLEDYPAYHNFGDKLQNKYEEDIYVGYRYFETFKPSAVQYGFGFGLSYTQFDINVIACSVSDEDDEKKLNIKLDVKNIGDTYCGKEVVQLYYGAPQACLGQPAKALGTFYKTKLLKPGETECVSLSMNFSEMATYDDGGFTGHRSAYVLEPGAYKFFVGNSVRSASEVVLDGKSSYVLERILLIEQLEEVMAPTQAFKRIKPGQCINGVYEITYEEVPLKSVDTLERMTTRQPSSVNYTGSKKYMLKDVKDGLVSMEMFIAQLDAVELATLVKGEGMCSPKVTAGAAAAFGGISDELQSYGIPVAAAADGPSGIRMDSGKTATQVTIGTLQACSWDTQVVEALYEEVGKELVLNNIDTLLGPGLNIHRHPLNGRNFEYFSEDPYLTGIFATAVTKGLREGGSIATLKHFTANDQEEERHSVDALISERALRELNLKGFEMAVKSGGAKSIMTSYNPINGIHAASNYDLNTTVLRKEWGFKGIVMTDWWAKVNHPVVGGIANTYKKSYMIKAQNDLYMVVGNDEAQLFENDDLLDALDQGSLTLGELQRTAVNICEFLVDSICFENAKREVGHKIYTANKEAFSKEIVRSDQVIVLNKKDKTGLTLEVLEAGQYQVDIKMRYDASSLAQASFNLLINNDYAVTIPLNGTDNAWKETTVLQVVLQAGYYEVGLDFLRPGIEVGEIRFSR